MSWKQEKPEEGKKTIGTVRAGHYTNSAYDDVLSTSLAPAKGWIPVDASNSKIVELVA